MLHRYEKVTPAHGKTIWLPMDDWEGTQFHLSPGNLYSDVQRIKIVAGEGFDLSLTLSARIPPVEQPADTKYLKFRKFRSELASRFWGRDIPVGVNILLPEGYEEHPNRRYPVVFHMGHFMEFTPLRFPIRGNRKNQGARASRLATLALGELVRRGYSARHRRHAAAPDTVLRRLLLRELGQHRAMAGRVDEGAAPLHQS